MPAPEPDNVKRLRGTDRADRKARRPAFVRGAPEPPASLSEVAADEWVRIMPDLVRNGLALADRGAVYRYVDAYARWVAAGAAMDAHEDGAVIRDVAHSGYRKHPAWQVWVQAGAAADRFAAALGLTPASRGRINVPAPDEATNGLLD